MRSVVGSLDHQLSGERGGGLGAWRGGLIGGTVFSFFLCIAFNLTFSNRNPSMTGKFLYVSDSISFIALNDLLALSSANVNSFLSEVGVSCAISPFVNYLSLFSCGCGGAKSGFFCFLLCFVLCYLSLISSFSG